MLSCVRIFLMLQILKFVAFCSPFGRGNGDTCVDSLLVLLLTRKNDVQFIACDSLHIPKSFRPIIPSTPLLNTK